MDKLAHLKQERETKTTLLYMLMVYTSPANVNSNYPKQLLNDIDGQLFRDLARLSREERERLILGAADDNAAAVADDNNNAKAKDAKKTKDPVSEQIDRLLAKHGITFKYKTNVMFSTCDVY